MATYSFLEQWEKEQRAEPVVRMSNLETGGPIILKVRYTKPTDWFGKKGDRNTGKESA